MSPTTLAIFVIVLLVLLYVFVLFVKHSSNKGLGKPIVGETDADTVEDYVATHGEPEAVFVLDVTRSNELNAVVLVYEHEVVINGRPVPRDKITKATFYNDANPYLNSDYLLVLHTSLPDQPTIKDSIGTDVEWAKQTTAELAQHLNI